MHKLPLLSNKPFVELSGTLCPGAHNGKVTISETQIVSILKEADAGMKVAELCRISDTMYYKWESEYGGMEASDLKRVRELEEQNAKLKRMYADMAPEDTAMTDLIAKKL